MRGILIIAALIAVIALAHWFTTHGRRHLDAAGDWFSLPRSMISKAGSVMSRTPTSRTITARSTTARSRRPAAEEPLSEDDEPQRSRSGSAPASEPPPDFSGVWKDEKNLALLRLKQVRSTLAGEYAPAGDRALVYQFQAKLQEDMDTARFDLKMSGVLHHCTLEWEDDSLVLRGQKDLAAMMSEYSMDGRLPNGMLVITRKSKEERALDRARLQKKRQEITKALDPVELGRFERIGK